MVGAIQKNKILKKIIFLKVELMLLIKEACKKD